MRSVVIDQFGAAGELHVAESPRPVAGPDEILVRVHGAAINPVDCKTRIGQGVARNLTDPFPLILGWDVSGVVEETNSPAFKVGDEVYAMARFPAIAGAYADYVAAPASDFALKPRTVDHNHAAAVPLAALTAWQALFNTAKLEKGQTVLVHAAAGGVGHFAVQLAKWKGATVIGTASARNHDFVEGLGADQVIDYTKVDFSEVAKDVDVVFHMISPTLRPQSFKTLRKDGILISITGPVPPEEAAAAGARGTFVGVRPNGAELAELAKLIDAGRLRPMIDTVYRLEEAADAHRHVDGGHARGKVVLEVR